MEFILLIIAGFVVYYLYVTFQEYLKNPLHKDKTPQKSPFLKTKPEITEDAKIIEVKAEELDNQKSFEKSELGVILSILKIIPNAKELCDLHTKISDLVISQYFSLPYLNKSAADKAKAKAILESKDRFNVLDLSKDLLNITYGEYKKRLKIIEFFTMILYIDGQLNESKNEFLLDIASSLELDNSDFNAIYESFESALKDPVDLKTTKDLDKNLDQIIPNLFSQNIHSANFLDAALILRQNTQNPPIKIKRTRKKKETEQNPEEVTEVTEPKQTKSKTRGSKK
ncbi:MAG: hypothetical protein E7K04_02710 [Helicobacter sp.]|nr:hypothetical protein [Helicobacter sp.]